MIPSDPNSKLPFDGTKIAAVAMDGRWVPTGAGAPTCAIMLSHSPLNKKKHDQPIPRLSGMGWSLCKILPESNLEVPPAIVARAKTMGVASKIISYRALIPTRLRRRQRLEDITV